jgi:D-cysteine desulfhydrase
MSKVSSATRWISATTMMTDAGSSGVPLFDHFPELARIPRAHLTTLPTPLEALPALPDRSLWVKRDDLTHTELGGNKVRALEFLLGPVNPGDVVLTVGGEGSTHVLATAYHAARLGARTHAIRWRHEMNPIASEVAVRAGTLCERITTTRTFPGTMARALWRRWRDARVHWIPMGGSSPLGVLGHVNAALELVHQVGAGAMPRPGRVVVPLGTGGTAAGLALGFAMSGASITVVCARIGPRIGANRRRVRALVRATSSLIARATGRPVPALRRGAIAVVHDVYGGAYGRPLPVATRAAEQMRVWRGLALDATYSAKAFAAALALPRNAEAPTLFWNTFDSRVLSGTMR